MLRSTSTELVHSNGGLRSDDRRYTLTRTERIVTPGFNSELEMLTCGMCCANGDELGEYSIRPGDVVLEVEGQNVAGYTRADVRTLLDYCANRGQHTLLLTFVQADASRSCLTAYACVANTVAYRLDGVVRATDALLAGDVLSRDIRAYLNCRFPQGSPEHDLQNTIRDNLYIRTVPCTTRAPRAGEVNGVDYHFLTKEEFASLEREGKLLESGFFEGNFYGTPLPNIQIQGQTTSLTAPLLAPGAHPSSEGKRKRNRSNVEAFLNPNKPLPASASIPMAPSTSAHLEQLTAGSDAGSSSNNTSHNKMYSNQNNNNNNNNNSNNSDSNHNQQDNNNHSSGQLLNNNPNDNTSNHNGYKNIVDSNSSYDGRASTKVGHGLHNHNNSNNAANSDTLYTGEVFGDNGTGEYGEGTTIVDDDLGPLPPHWEKAYTEQGEPYFINLETNNSQWDDPRLCGEDGTDGGLVAEDPSSQLGQIGETPCSPLTPLGQLELPYGWERIEDPQYGTYYIDHINKRTQYESPLVAQATLDGSQILSGNAVLNTSGSTLSIAMSSSVREDDVAPGSESLTLPLGASPNTPHPNSDGPQGYFARQGVQLRLGAEVQLEHEGAQHGSSFRAGRIPHLRQRETHGMPLAPGHVYGSKVMVTESSSRATLQQGYLQQQQPDRQSVSTQMTGSEVGNHSRSRSDLVGGMQYSTVNKGCHRDEREWQRPIHGTVSKNSSVDPLYATIGPKKNGRVTHHHLQQQQQQVHHQQQQRQQLVQSQSLQKAQQSDGSSVYMTMGPVPNLVSGPARNGHPMNGLMTTHNYANVYEPQYRMSEGQRHRENGMISSGDDLEKINESQATENDSVFTSGGNNELDLSLRSDPDTKAEDANNNNNSSSSSSNNKDDVGDQPADGGPLSGLTADKKEPASIENVSSAQMNGSRDGILALMPCLASCMQDKTYGTVGDTRKKDLAGVDGAGKRHSVPAGSGHGSLEKKLKDHYDIIEVPKRDGEQNERKQMNNTGGGNASEPSNKAGDNHAVVTSSSVKGGPNANSTSQNSLTAGRGSGTSAGSISKEAMLREDQHGNPHKAAPPTISGNVSVGGNPAKIPPPTLSKPVLSQHQPLLPPQYQLPYVFTRNPAQLVGEIVHVGLVKSPRGFGFTIVGGNDHQAEEFLQIKSITQGGPAWNDGTLRTGDVLVHVNGICVLGYTHGDVVSLFQSIAPGEVVHLQICRGYKLPFDLDDPNMEIVTTQAVTANGPYDNNHVDKPAVSDNESLVSRSVVGASQEYQDIYGTVVRKMRSIDLSKGSLGGSAVVGAGVRTEPSVGATLSSSNVEQHNSLHDESELDFEAPKFLTVEIVKGNTGFGFTIADSANGQKVKKILDKNRCEDLVEGDILVDINGHNVRRSLHAEVVQVLKECLIGSTARITVQRGGFATSRSQAAGARTPVNAADDAGSDRASHASTSFSQFNFNPNPSAFQYRSKTPTADLYGSAREVVIQRPKTPVVDTRNWDSPEKPPRTGPPAGVQQLQGLQHRSGGQTVPDANINNSIYGTTLGLASQMSPAYGNVGGTQSRFDDDVYGHVRSKSEVWHYDYPTPAGARQSHTMSRNAHSAVLPSQGDYANYYALYGNDRGVTPQPSYDPTGQHSIYGTAESVRYAESLRAPSAQGGAVLPAGVYGEGGGSGGNGEFQVTLSRQESGFGFRIVGGTEEGSQVTIGHIVPGGAADLDGSIQTGDEILSVDGHSVANASHHHVVQLIGAASISGQVTLGLRRRVPGLHNTSGQSGELPSTGYTYEVLVERTESEGFGFVIISSVGRSGSTIGRIIEGSPAERCGRLQVGDRIHAVNGVSILDMHHEDIVTLIKVSGLTVTLTIAPRASSTGTLSPGNNIQDDLSSIGTSRPLGPDDFNDQPIGGQMLSASSLIEGQMLPSASPAGGPPEFRRVVLQRGARGFGFSIRGGREFHNMPLFVLRIAEMGPAQKSGQLHVGDQLLEVNGICTDGMTHAEAISLIRQGDSTVSLLIKRNSNPPAGTAGGSALYSPQHHHHLQQQQQQHASQQHQAQHPLTVESPPSLLSHHSLGGPISQSSPRSPSAMLLHSPHHHPGGPLPASGVPTSIHQSSGELMHE
ncbi:membrane-associated guanylate kinase, partial [Tropilaelaps mercedesae]